MAEEKKITPEVEVPTTPEKEVKQDDANQEESKAKFTQEDLNKLAAKTRAEEKVKAEKAIEEERRLAKLSEEERKVERQKKHDEELSVREKELKVATNKLEFTKRFEADEIPASFIDYITDENTETMESNYVAFKAKWSNELNKKLEEKVKPKENPKAFNVNSAKPKSLVRSF